MNLSGFTVPLQCAALVYQVTQLRNAWQHIAHRPQPHAIKSFLMIATKNLPTILTLVLFPMFLPILTSAQTVSAHPKTYPLNTWSNITCRAKGRFQDRGYCVSVVMDQIVADGKFAIPVLISQITDARWIAEPVYDYWRRIRTGELAYFILEDLLRRVAAKHHALVISCAALRRTRMGLLGKVSEDS